MKLPPSRTEGAREAGDDGEGPSVIRVLGRRAQYLRKPWPLKPVLYSILIGLALFAIYRWRSIAVQSSDVKRIEAAQGDLGRQDLTFTVMRHGRGRPAEVGTRNPQAQAVSLGLGAFILQRRLAQIMEFLRDDASAIDNPGTGELKAWFTNNRGHFLRSSQISFRHLCFSFDREGQGARELAIGSLQKLTGRPVDSDPDVANLADHVKLPSYYSDRTPEQVSNVFGGTFARSLFRLKAGRWQGPIESGLGWHVVWIDSIRSRMPAFTEVEAEVKSDWMIAQRADLRRRHLETMNASYKTVLH